MSKRKPRFIVGENGRAVDMKHEYEAQEGREWVKQVKLNHAKKSDELVQKVISDGLKAHERKTLKSGGKLCGVFVVLGVMSWEAGHNSAGLGSIHACL
jgi:hypothetical protein